MPYDKDNPPDKIKSMPKEAQSIFVAAFNSALDQYDGDEGKANAVAYSAVEKAGYVKQDDKWVPIEAENDKLGIGGTDNCICVDCNYEMPHERGKPCNEMTCPKCGGEMAGKGMPKTGQGQTNTELYILPLGQAEKVELEGGNLFKKKLIEVGEWADPRDPKKKLKITAARMKSWVDKFKQNYAKVFVPNRHSLDPKDNTGWLKDLEVKGKALFGTLSLSDDTAKNIKDSKIEDVSVGIHPDFVDGKGKKWGEVLEHVALTLIPHIKEQGEGEDGAFVPLEIAGREVICMERVEEEKDETVLKDFTSLKEELVKLESNLVKAIKEGGEKIMAEKEKEVQKEEKVEEKKEEYSVTELERQKIKDAQEKVTMLETEVNSLRDYRERKEVEEIDSKLQVLLESAKITPAIKDRLRGVVLASRATKIELEGKQQPMAEEILSILAELPAQVDTNEYSKTELERPASGTVDAEAESNRILEGKAPEK